jgi:hypothetical protein
MNITRFLNDEVAFLEQLKAKHSEMLAKKEAQKGETLNRILDEAMEKLKKYDKIDFHPLAKTEIRYLYGAMREFGKKELPAILHIFRGTPEYKDLQDAIHTLEKLCIQRGGNFSPRIVEHIKALMDANGSQSLMEKETQELLKSTCIALDRIATLGTKLISENKVSDKLLMNMDEKEYPKSADYKGLTHKQALQSIIEYCNQFIDDFRMRSIVSGNK